MLANDQDRFDDDSPFLRALAWLGVLVCVEIGRASG